MNARDPKMVASDLRLSIYLRALHPEFFDIRASRAFDDMAFGGQVWLIDGGHVILFIDGPDAITEVIAPKALELPKRGLLRAVDLARHDDHRLDARGTLLYRMAYQAEVCTAGAYRREAEELLAATRQGHLYVDGDATGLSRGFSYAVPEPRGRGLLVHAWHGFAAERTILRTQTLIERV